MSDCGSCGSDCGDCGDEDCVDCEVDCTSRGRQSGHIISGDGIRCNKRCCCWFLLLCVVVALVVLWSLFGGVFVVFQ